MKISHEMHDRVCVQTLSGSLTHDHVDALRRAIEERLGAGAEHIVLALEHLQFIDSEGLESLLDLADSLELRGGQLRLVNPDETVRRILEITRLDRRFDTHPTLESAARSLRRSQ